MIRIILGNIGSGKSASIVREIILNKTDRITYSNITITGCKNAVKITPEMIVKVDKEAKAQKDKYKVNKEFWISEAQSGKKINVVIDEAHTVLNPRRSMSQLNVVMTDWLSLLRRIIGANSQTYGELVLITQLERRLDVISREMATLIQFYICHYVLTCKKCKKRYAENNETADKLKVCPRCGHNSFNKNNHVIEVYEFTNIDLYNDWKENGRNTFFKHYLINDIEKYFKHYNTFQWEDLLSEI